VAVKHRYDNRRSEYRA